MARYYLKRQIRPAHARGRIWETISDHVTELQAVRALEAAIDRNKVVDAKIVGWPPGSFDPGRGLAVFLRGRKIAISDQLRERARYHYDADLQPIRRPAAAPRGGD